MKYFEEPYEEYTKCIAEIYIGTKNVAKDVKCFLWLPQKPQGAPHVYLFMDELKDRKLFFNLNKPHNIINLRINIKFANGQTYKTHILENLSFHGSESTVIADDWNESYIKYSFPEFVITQTPVNKGLEYKLRFFITESSLLKSMISVRQHQTGEISRKILSKICIEKELKHFGIKLMETEQYIGSNTASIIEITPMEPINSMLVFYQKVQPIMDLILLITSFAEGRRLNWYKCEGYIGTNFVEIYNSRATFYDDNRATSMKNEQFFKVFLKHSLQNIEADDVRFISKTLRAYLSAKDFTAEVSIILWFSLLEKILKHEFGNIKKKDKEDLLRQLGVHLFDYPPMNEMIKMRNNIAHGDDLDSDKVFKMYLYWEKLINETLYAILKWDRSIEIQVYVDEK